MRQLRPREPAPVKAPAFPTQARRPMPNFCAWAAQRVCFDEQRMDGDVLSERYIAGFAQPAPWGGLRPAWVAAALVGGLLLLPRLPVMFERAAHAATARVWMRAVPPASMPDRVAGHLIKRQPAKPHQPLWKLYASATAEWKKYPAC